MKAYLPEILKPDLREKVFEDFLICFMKNKKHTEKFIHQIYKLCREYTYTNKQFLKYHQILSTYDENINSADDLPKEIFIFGGQFPFTACQVRELFRLLSHRKQVKLNSLFYFHFILNVNLILNLNLNWNRLNHWF